MGFGNAKHLFAIWFHFFDCKLTQPTQQAIICEESSFGVNFPFRVLLVVQQVARQLRTSKKRLSSLIVLAALSYPSLMDWSPCYMCCCCWWGYLDYHYVNEALWYCHRQLVRHSPPRGRVYLLTTFDGIQVAARSWWIYTINHNSLSFNDASISGAREREMDNKTITLPVEYKILATLYYLLLLVRVATITLSLPVWRWGRSQPLNGY